MLCRPVDSSGDILPVLSAPDLLTGIRAEAEGIRNRLQLLTGDWWENPAWGNGILDMLKESRLTEADQQALANYITGYIRKTPGVLDVREVKYSVGEGRFRCSCEIVTENGTAVIHYG
ncbi:MAG: hypothetical protein IKZ98_02435 [Clostridia bacterium]|nr:hypothetical protein [Clostridia bacterium]